MLWADQEHECQDNLNSVVAVYSTHPQAEEALRAFQSSGFDMKKLSIASRVQRYLIATVLTGSASRNTPGEDDVSP